jgi:hypothetical protein
MRIFLLTIILFYTNLSVNAQTGIGTVAPDASAKLDVFSTNKGFLPPRVALTATNSASPISTPASGLIVYNTATNGTAPNNVSPGYYYWNGSAWINFIGSSTSSTLTGNGTTSTLSNFGSVLNDQSGTSYILTSSDNGKIITFNNSSPITLYVPYFSIGFNCMVIQKGTGQVTLSISGTTTNIFNRYGFSKTAGQYAILTLVCQEQNKYISSGDMSN